MDFNGDEPTYYGTNFPANKIGFYIHDTMPYIHPRLDSRIGPILPDLHKGSNSRHCINNNKIIALKQTANEGSAHRLSELKKTHRTLTVTRQPEDN